MKSNHRTCARFPGYGLAPFRKGASLCQLAFSSIYSVMNPRVQNLSLEIPSPTGHSVNFFRLFSPVGIVNHLLSKLFFVELLVRFRTVKYLNTFLENVVVHSLYTTLSSFPPTLIIALFLLSRCFFVFFFSSCTPYLSVSPVTKQDLYLIF